MKNITTAITLAAIVTTQAIGQCTGNIAPRIFNSPEVIAPGSPAPPVALCGPDGVVDLAELYAGPDPVLVVGVSSTWPRAVENARRLKWADSTYGIRTIAIYTHEAMPDSTHSDSTMQDRITSAHSLSDYTGAWTVADNASNEFWHKYGTRLHPAFLIRDGVVCYSWNAFTWDNFSGHLAYCHATGIDRPAEGRKMGIAFNLMGGHKRMTEAEFRRQSEFHIFKPCNY
jgi:hypothetical protein